MKMSMQSIWINLSLPFCCSAVARLHLRTLFVSNCLSMFTFNLCSLFIFRCTVGIHISSAHVLHLHFCLLVTGAFFHFVFFVCSLKSYVEWNELQLYEIFFFDCYMLTTESLCSPFDRGLMSKKKTVGGSNSSRPIDWNDRGTELIATNEWHLSVFQFVGLLFLLHIVQRSIF